MELKQARKSVCLVGDRYAGDETCDAKDKACRPEPRPIPTNWLPATRCNIAAGRMNKHAEARPIPLRAKIASRTSAAAECCSLPVAAAAILSAALPAKASAWTMTASTALP
eukprot:1904153-Pleurochrysis_carterae.AAC.1